MKNDLEAARLLESAAGRLRRHKGPWDQLKLRMIRMIVEEALGKLPKPGEPQRKEVHGE
jgi:hypothetical protein